MSLRKWFVYGDQVCGKRTDALNYRNGSSQLVKGHHDLLGPGSVDSIQTSKHFDYPAPIPGYDFLMILDCFDRSHVDGILDYLVNQKLIDGDYRQVSPGIFLLKFATIGEFGLRIDRTLTKVFISKYEPEHDQHRGCVAPGYSYFLCNSRKTRMHEQLASGTLNGVTFIVSRSYNSVCSGICRSRKSAGLLSWRDSNVVLPSWRSTVNDVLKGEEGTCDMCGTARETAELSLLSALGIFLKDEMSLADVQLSQAPCDSCSPRLSDELSKLHVEVFPKKVVETSRSRESGKVDTRKYREKKYYLLSKYQVDLDLSDLAWYSLPPEPIAKHIASRICQLSKKLKRPLRVLDPFCRAGGYIIHLASMPNVERAFGLDKDVDNIACAKRIANRYGVAGKIDFEVCDFLEEYFYQEIDAIIFSPPWGGPDYLRAGKFDINEMPMNLKKMLSRSRELSDNMAIILPRSICLDQLVDEFPHQSRKDIGSRAIIELELNLICDEPEFGERFIKPKTTTAYYGQLVFPYAHENP